MPVGEMLARMGGGELIEWAAHYKIEADEAEKERKKREEEQKREKARAKTRKRR